MKLQTALILASTTLFFNNVYAMSTEATACNTAVEKGNLSAALTQANKVLGSNNNDKDALICKGRALSAQGDLDGAVAAFKLADTLSSSDFDKSIVTLLTGHAYRQAKKNEQAMTSYQQSLAFAQSANNQTLERINQSLIGDIHFENKQYALALTAYSAAGKLAANDNERGESYEKIALTHHILNQNDLALEYQIKAYLMNEQVGTLDQYAHSSIELGRYYTIAKNYISAENTLNKIIKFAKEQGGAYFEAQGSYMLAKVKVATGDTPSAKALIEHAKLIAKNTNDKALDEEIDQETRNLF